ncbi:hypothetical protein M5D96_003361 [Drosophila gunungcola]|uniref:Uncharacterized protein n=1 Tax=Drosophila gunungcola TaxID=103775 RepID=A0A9P9YS49_9MUSC|nr:hypothetical protein M5D96_003361 [Drosophila gunungcola]
MTLNVQPHAHIGGPLGPLSSTQYPFQFPFPSRIGLQTFLEIRPGLFSALSAFNVTQNDRITTTTAEVEGAAAAALTQRWMRWTPLDQNIT